VGHTRAIRRSDYRAAEVTHALVSADPAGTERHRSSKFDSFRPLQPRNPLVSRRTTGSDRSHHDAFAYGVPEAPRSSDHELYWSGDQRGWGRRDAYWSSCQSEGTGRRVLPAGNGERLIDRGQQQSAWRILCTYRDPPSTVAPGTKDASLVLCLIAPFSYQVGCARRFRVARWLEARSRGHAGPEATRPIAQIALPMAAQIASS
jgi:hypothetical protein